MTFKRTFLCSFYIAIVWFSSVSNGINGIPNTKWGDYPRPSLRRFERATEREFENSVDKMSLMARIIVPISLELGLIDGSIPIEQTIAELLNIPSMNISQLVSFSNDDIVGFVSKMKNLNLAKNTVVDQMEGLMLLLNGYQEINEKLGDVKKMTVSEKFFGKVNELKSSLNVPTIPDIDKIVEPLKYLKQLPNNIDATTSIKVAAKLLDLQPLLRTLTSETTTKVENVCKNIRKFQLLTDGTIPLDSNHLQLVNLIEDVSSKINIISTRSDNDLNELANSLVVSLSISPEISASKTNFEMMMIIANHPIGPKTFTIGLSNGFSDLSSLSTDSKNTWFQTAIGIDVSSGLKYLQPLFNESSNVINKWSIVDKNKIESIDTLIHLQSSFSNIQSIASKEFNTLTSINKKIQAVPNDINYHKDAFNIYKKASELIKTSSSAIESASEVSSLVNQDKMKHVEDLIQKIILPSDKLPKDYIPGVINDIRALGDLQNMINWLNSLKTSLEKLKEKIDGGTTNLKLLVNDFSGAKTTVGSFVNHQQTTKYINFFNGLKNVKNELKEVSKAIQMTQTIRRLQKDNNFQTNVLDVSKAISNSIPHIHELRRVSADVKTIKEPEIERIKRLKGLQSHSNAFGEAVTFIQNIQKTLKLKEKLIQLAGSQHLIEGEIKTIGDKTKKNELKNEWGTVPSQEINQLIQNLESKRDGLPKLDDPSFASYSTLFTSFNGLQDLDVKSSKRLEILEKLIENNPTSSQLNNLKTSLESIETLDMEFAKYRPSVSGIQTTINKIILAFANGTDKSTAPSVVNFYQNIPRIINDILSAGTEISETLQKTDTLVPTILGAVGLLLVLGISGGGTYLQLLPIEEEEEDDSDDEDDDEDEDEEDEEEEDDSVKSSKSKESLPSAMSPASKSSSLPSANSPGSSEPDPDADLPELPKDAPMPDGRDAD